MQKTAYRRLQEAIEAEDGEVLYPDRPKRTAQTPHPGPKPTPEVVVEMRRVLHELAAEESTHPMYTEELNMDVEALELVCLVPHLIEACLALQTPCSHGAAPVRPETAGAYIAVTHGRRQQW